MPITVVAIVLLFDSSLALAADWVPLIQGYIIPIIGRLYEFYPHHSSQVCASSLSAHWEGKITKDNIQFRVSIITYGPADHCESPLLETRFFMPPFELKKELESYSKLGIGRTGSGGSNGMAALDAYAAAIEVWANYNL